MKNYFLLISMLLLMISSCCKPSISVRTILKNTTSQQIKLQYFDRFGQVHFTTINSKSETLVPFLGFFNKPGVYDSVFVSHDGILQEIHYSSIIKKTVSNATIVQFENPRNLLNELNFHKTRKELSCSGSDTLYSFSF